MITLALVVALLAPDRGPSTVPLVHVAGWYQISDASGVIVDWDYAPPEQDVAMTLLPGEWVTVGWRGSCTLAGVTHRATLLTPARCAS